MERSLLLCVLIVSLTNTGASFMGNWVPQERIDMAGNATTYSCNPALDCQTQGIGASVPDPEDCHNYYICLNSGGESVPSDITIPCQDGYYFDQGSGSCAFENTPCTNECYNICNLECKIDFELVAYPGNCSLYYACLPGDKIVRECPSSNPYFNGQDCTGSPYGCCDSCIPYCSAAFTETADPLDCNKFYICVATGLPSEEYHGSCPDGQHFDSSSGFCVDGEDCTNLC